VPNTKDNILYKLTLVYSIEVELGFLKKNLRCLTHISVIDPRVSAPFFFAEKESGMLAQRKRPNATMTQVLFG